MKLRDDTGITKLTKLINSKLLKFKHNFILKGHQSGIGAHARGCWCPLKWARAGTNYCCAYVIHQTTMVNMSKLQFG